MTTDPSDPAGRGSRPGSAMLEAAASATLAEALLGLATEFEEAGDAPAADLAVWLAELYARIGHSMAVADPEEGMEDAPEHAYETDVMLRVAARIDEESAYLRGRALDPMDGVSFLAARSAEALVALLRSEAAEGDDE